MTSAKKAIDRGGQIVTFYSYKGGTGRSMAVANVGWILASAGKRVLLIDWDLEAPGLHRYFRPFLQDQELESSPGLIDFFVAFATAARSQTETETSDAWYEPYASMVPYTIPVEWEFDHGGALELVPAGQQDPAYAMRATSFDWQHFYEHGGGVFLELVKKKLRAEYDVVIIDSRTGISDTSGICTVQMPDQLVVLFTLNRQSIKGASAIADSADKQRRREDGKPSLVIWPVPTRVERAEVDRLEAAQEAARETFDRFLAHLPREERAEHWTNIEVLYQPYYAYEEVLAPFRESRRTPGSMLASMEEIASLLTRPHPVSVKPIHESMRKEVLAKFERRKTGAEAVASAASAKGMVFISYSTPQSKAALMLYRELQSLGIETWIDQAKVRLGDDYARAHFDAIEASSVVLFLVGPGNELSDWREHEMNAALVGGKVLAPILVDGAGYSDLPKALMTRQAMIIRGPEDIALLGNELNHLIKTRAAAAHPVDPNDPQKGRWGGQALRSGRELSATVRELSDHWYEVVLEVKSRPDDPLQGAVQFHLHPTFARPVQVVEAKDGRATLALRVWGAFTVGAVADDGRTTLELDLAADERFPEAFRRH